MTEVAKKEEKNMQLGMIGVERMDGSMAVRLIRSGHQVVVLSPERSVEDCREDKLDGKGVAFCSICDAPFCSDLYVAVAGSGNATRDVFRKIW